MSKIKRFGILFGCFGVFVAFILIVQIFFPQQQPFNQWLELFLVVPVTWAAYLRGLKGGLAMALLMVLVSVFCRLSVHWPQDPIWETGLPYWALYFGVALFLGVLVHLDPGYDGKPGQGRELSWEQGSMDRVTPCFHRRFMEQELWRHWEKAQNLGKEFCLLLLDLNHFNELNKNFGVLAGDRVLRSTVQTILNNVRQSDVVGRFGEDQFLVVLPKCSEQNALQLGKRLRREMAKLTFSDPRKPFKADFSVGVVAFTPEFKTLPEMLRQLARSLHREKQKMLGGMRAS